MFGRAVLWSALRPAFCSNAPGFLDLFGNATPRFLFLPWASRDEVPTQCQSRQPACQHPVPDSRVLVIEQSRTINRRPGLCYPAKDQPELAAECRRLKSMLVADKRSLPEISSGGVASLRDLLVKLQPRRPPPRLEAASRIRSSALSGLHLIRCMTFAGEAASTITAL
jgi:hypothetical protein